MVEVRGMLWYRTGGAWFSVRKKGSVGKPKQIQLLRTVRLSDQFSRRALING